MNRSRAKQNSLNRFIFVTRSRGKSDGLHEGAEPTRRVRHHEGGRAGRHRGRLSEVRSRHQRVGATHEDPGESRTTYFESLRLSAIGNLA